MLCKRDVTSERSKTIKRTRHCVPHLTDLEIAFRSDVLGHADDWASAFDSTGLDNAMRVSTETEYMNKFVFGRAGTSKLIKLKFGNHATHTDNLPRSGGNPMRLVTRQTFGRSFKNGLIKVFKVLRSLSNENLDGFVDRFIGCKVRFHAMGTPGQLHKIRSLCAMGLEATGTAGLKASRAAFRNSLLSDWNRFDVAYYVKHIGGVNSGQVDHIGQGGVVTTIPGGAGATGGNTFSTVKDRIKNLPGDEALEGFCEAIKVKVTRAF